VAELFNHHFCKRKTSNLAGLMRTFKEKWKKLVKSNVVKISDLGKAEFKGYSVLRTTRLNI
jgi:hypothetical protein